MRRDLGILRRSAGHSNMQLRLRITNSIHYEMFKKINGKVGLREIYICKLQIKQTASYIFTASFYSQTIHLLG